MGESHYFPSTSFLIFDRKLFLKRQYYIYYNTIPFFLSSCQEKCMIDLIIKSSTIEIEKWILRTLLDDKRQPTVWFSIIFRDNIHCCSDTCHCCYGKCSFDYYIYKVLLYYNDVSVKYLNNSRRIKKIPYL